MPSRARGRVCRVCHDTRYRGSSAIYAKYVPKNAPGLQAVRREHSNRGNLTRREVRDVVAEDGKIYSD
jgi:hypothetical protein